MKKRRPSSVRGRRRRPVARAAKQPPKEATSNGTTHLAPANKEMDPEKMYEVRRTHRAVHLPGSLLRLSVREEGLRRSLPHQEAWVQQATPGVQQRWLWCSGYRTNSVAYDPPDHNPPSLEPTLVQYVPLRRLCPPARRLTKAYNRGKKLWDTSPPSSSLPPAPFSAPVPPPFSAPVPPPLLPPSLPPTTQIDGRCASVIN